MPHLTGLKSNDILSSLSKSLDNSFKWAGDIVADVKNWDKGQPTAEKCAALNNDKIKSVKCDAQNNFMCETNTKPRYFCSLPIYLSLQRGIIFCSIPSGFQIRPIDSSKTHNQLQIIYDYNLQNSKHRPENHNWRKRVHHTIRKSKPIKRYYQIDDGILFQKGHSLRCEKIV